MSDAELAAKEREEAAAGKTAASAADAVADDADTAPAATQPAPQTAAATPTPHASDAPAVQADKPAATPAARSDTPYILQAGAFGASGDAEAVKARIALLGLGARVESAQISGKTVYRVRMGPYATASELAEAKRKLAGGGLPAMAIQAR